MAGCLGGCSVATAGFFGELAEEEMMGRLVSSNSNNSNYDKWLG